MIKCIQNFTLSYLFNKREAKKKVLFKDRRSIEQMLFSLFHYCYTKNNSDHCSFLMKIFGFFYSCQIWSCTETWKSAYFGGYATKYSKSRSSKNISHRIGWSTAIIGVRAASPYGNMRIYPRKSFVHATES